MKYIYLTNNSKYELRKRVNGKLTYFGVFNTLDDAKRYREYCMRYDWNVDPYYPKMKYITRQDGRYYIVKTINGKKELFGSFDNLEDAIFERDLCVSCDWDMDLLVEMPTNIHGYVDTIKVSA